MTDGRRAGPLGRALRLATGLVLTLLAARHMMAVETAVNLQGVGVVLGLVALYTGLHLAIGRFTPSLDPRLGAVVALVPLVLAFLLVGPALHFAVLLFLGVSLVVTAIRADAGCEVMTLPALLLGSRTHLVCLVFSPLDWAEGRLGDKRRTTSPQESRR